MRSAFVPDPAPVLTIRTLRGSLKSVIGKKLSIIWVIILFPCFCISQIDSTELFHPEIVAPEGLQIGAWDQNAPQEYLSNKQKTQRQIFIGAVNVIGYGGSLLILSNTWYRNYPHTSFHTFNDVGEWMQV